MINPRIEELAWNLLARNGVTGPPVNVEDIATSEGIQVVRQQSSGTESGFLLRDGYRTLIGLNASNPKRRQRFTIAHELGHWNMHKGKPLIIDHEIKINKRNETSSQATDREEIEANAYAAALLMPSSFVMPVVRREVALGISKIDQLTENLANLFEVSSDAMKWRLVNLGVIN